MKGFHKTRVPNLVRRKASGGYYVRLRIGGGREICRSLNTCIESIARLKLPGELARLRMNAGRLNMGDLTLGECAELYMERLRLHGHPKRGPLKPRSLEYRRQTLTQWRRLVPGFDRRRPMEVLPMELNAWLDRVRSHYGATRYNGMIQTLRACFQVAVDSGACIANPMAGVRAAPVRLPRAEVPTREMFGRILLELDRRGRNAARLSVRALAFTGLRPNEARHLQPADVDLEHGTILARETKNGQPRRILLLPQAMELLRDEGVEPVLAALRKSPKHALHAVGAKLGLKLTPYTLRHYHLTALVESGIDLATVAELAGHQDRGVTLLRHYARPRPEHVRRMMSGVVI